MDDCKLHFADRATQVSTTVVEHECLARDTYRLRFRAPQIAAQVTPGQFLMLRLADCDDPLIGRPLAVYDVAEDCVDVVYLVGGKLTSRLCNVSVGRELVVWGPLGNGFAPQVADELIMVAGGIGQTPFLALAKEHLGLQRFGGREVATVPRIVFCYGARSKAYFADLQRFETAGVELALATDDGTAGEHGFVTAPLRRVLGSGDATIKRRIVCCGPEPMMEAVSQVGADFGVPVEVSLETPMACGIGICFSCVAQIRDDRGEPDYRRTCVEGPVFEASRVVW